MILSEQNFGEVITVFNNIPFKFNVKALELGADSANKYRQFTRAYVFEDASTHQSIKKYSFEIKLRDEVESYYSKADDLHNAGILLGLLSKRHAPDESKFEIDLNKRAALLSNEILEGQQLSDEILKFYLDVYLKWPRQGIGLPDIQDNFTNSQEDLKQWHHHLINSQNILRKQGNVTFRVERGMITTSSYTLNPMKLDEIKMKFTNIKPRNALVDPNNHRHFKLVDIQSEINGRFAFVLMPFKEKEFPQEIFQKVFQPVVREVLGMNCVKVDNDKFKNYIESKIYSHIVKSNLIIAELSTENPNVIFELALSFGFEKEIITTYFNKFGKGRRRLSFDFEHYDTIFYDNLNQLESELRETLIALKTKQEFS